MAAILSRPEWDAMSNSISFHWSRDCLKRFSRLTTNIYQNSALLARYDQWISHTKGQVMRKVRPCHMQMMFMTATWLPTQINIAFSCGFLRSRMLCQTSTRHLFIRSFEMSKWDRFEKTKKARQQPHISEQNIITDVMIPELLWDLHDKKCSLRNVQSNP